MISIFLFFLISCQKNETNQESPVSLKDTTVTVIDGHLKSVINVLYTNLPDYEKKVVNGLNKNWNLKTLQVSTYSHSSIKVYSLKDASDPDLILLIFSNEGKHFKALCQKERITYNLQKIKFTSLQGLEYFDFMLLDEEYGSHLNVKNELPFNQIISKNETTNARPLVEAPIEVTVLCTDLKFDDCMNCALKECNDDWKCWLMCSLGTVACAIGWAIGCA